MHLTAGISRHQKVITVCKDSKVMFTLYASLTAPRDGIGDLLANMYCCFSIGFVFYSEFRFYFWFSQFYNFSQLVIVSITKTTKPLTKRYLVIVINEKTSFSVLVMVSSWFPHVLV